MRGTMRLLTWGALAAVCLPVWAGDVKDVNPEEIIQKFAAKEAELMAV